MSRNFLGATARATGSQALRFALVRRTKFASGRKIHLAPKKDLLRWAQTELTHAPNRTEQETEENYTVSISYPKDEYHLS